MHFMPTFALALFLFLIILFLISKLISHYKLRQLIKNGIYPVKGQESIDDVKKLLQQGHHIFALKLYRSLTQKNFKDAKEDLKNL